MGCQPVEYRMSDPVRPYKFEQNSNKCLLFRVTQENLWFDFVYLSCTKYDVAVIFDVDNEKQSWFLNKVFVNWIDKVIEFGESEIFTPKHLGLINKFGQESNQSLDFSNFELSNLNNVKAIKRIIFYQWNPNKKQVSEEKSTKNLKINIKTKKVKKDKL